MNIQDIFDRVLLKSGQYIVTKSKVEINIDSFRLLVEDSLAVYNRYSPYDRKFTKEIVYPRQIDMSQVQNQDPQVLKVPKFLAKVTPIRYGASTFVANFFNTGNGNSINGSSELIDPIMAPWDYSAPLLTVPISCRYEIQAVYDHVVEVMDVPQGQQKQYQIKTITLADQAFFDHVRAMFLQGIGRSRKAFTMTELPITMDGDSLVSDGLQLEEKAKADMENVQKFYLAMG